MKSLSKFLCLVALAFTFTATAQAADAPMSIDGAKTVDSAAIIDLVGAADNLVILDNRKEADFNAGHIEGAIRLIDTDINSAEDLAKVAAKDQPVLFYCNGVKCGRAANAVKKAVGFGYSNLYYYALGMEDWKAQGLPLASQ